MQIIEFCQFDKRLASDVRCLALQLSSTAHPPSDETLQEIIFDPSTHLILAVNNGCAIGMLTLVFCSIPTGLKALIEDVIVGENYRKQGVGEDMLRMAIDIGIARKARKIDLTSQGIRIEANSLYRKIGFEQRSTNVFRFVIAQDAR